MAVPAAHTDLIRTSSVMSWGWKANAVDPLHTGSLTTYSRFAMSALPPTEANGN